MSLQNYFNQTRTGTSNWWSWPTVFWVMLLTWIAGQLVFGIGMFMAGMVVAPEIMQQMMDASISAQAEQSDITSFFSTAFLFSTLLGLAGLLITLTTEGAVQRRMGILTAVAIAASYISLFAIAPSMFGDAEANNLMLQVIGISPIAYMFMLLTFPAALLGLYLGQKFIHKRTLTSLHTGWNNFRWRRAFQAFFIMWAVLAIFGIGLNYLMGGELRYAFDPTRFFFFAIISLALLPIQSATEEIVFRGYLNQGLMHFFKNKWVVFIITSLLFMAMHLANPEALEGSKQGILPIVMSGYFFFGFACCLMTLIDDGLESAIGVHAGNNTFAALFVNYENSVLPTPSVFVTKADPVMDSLSTIVILTIVLVILWYLKPQKKQEFS